MLDRADRGQSVIAQSYAVAARQEQPAAAILANHMAGVDMIMQFEVNGVAPGPVDRVGMDHEDAVGGRLHRNVEEIAPAMLSQADRPYRPDILVQCRSARLPVDQVAAMPDRNAGIAVECGEGHVIIRAIFEDGRIRAVARNQRIEEAPVAQIGDTLIVETPFPVRRGHGRCGSLRAAKRQRAPRQYTRHRVAPTDRHSLSQPKKPGRPCRGDPVMSLTS